MSLSLPQTYRAPIRALLANIVTCLALMHLVQLEPVWACDEYLAASKSSEDTSSAAILRLRADLLNRKKGFSLLPQPKLLSAQEIAESYAGLPKGWSYRIDDKEIDVHAFATSYPDTLENKPLMQAQNAEARKLLSANLLLRFLPTVDWTTAQLQKALPEEEFELGYVDIRIADDHQSPGNHLMLAKIPHADYGYFTVIASFFGDGTIYWDEHRQEHQMENGEMLIMTGRRRLQIIKVRPTLHKIPTWRPSKRLIVIMQYRAKSK